MNKNAVHHKETIAVDKEDLESIFRIEDSLNDFVAVCKKLDHNGASIELVEEVALYLRSFRIKYSKYVLK